MEQDAAVPGTSFGDSESVIETEAPLSPIVGSAGSLAGRKFRSRRRRRQQQQSESVSTEPEVEVVPKPQAKPRAKPNKYKLKQARVNFEAFESVSSTTKSDLGHVKDLDVVLRLKKLEALKLQKANIAKAISCDIPQPIILIDEKPFATGKPVEIKPITKTGQSINISNVDMKSSMKLFDDIVNSTISHCSKNKNSLDLDEKISVKQQEAFKSESFLDDEHFDGFRGFDKASVENSQSKLHQSDANLGKNIVETENFNDLKLGDNVGFEKVSFGSGSASKNDPNNLPLTNMFEKENKSNSFSSNADPKNQNKNVRVAKTNIFGGENFDDLMLGENVGFKKASFAFGNVLKVDQKSALGLNSKSMLPKKSSSMGGDFEGDTSGDSKLKRPENRPNKLSNNIFEGENFDDLMLGESIGFKKASDGFKNATLHLKINHQDSAHSSTSSFNEGHNIPSKNSFVDDLNLKTCGFQSASASMQNKKESMCKSGNFSQFGAASNKKTVINIFEGENFDDLNLGVCGFQSASVKHGTFKPFGVASDTAASTAARNIFEGENFSDLAGLTLKPMATLPSKSMKKFNTPFKTPLKSPVKNCSDSNEGQRTSDHNTPENNLLKKSSQKRLGYRGSYTPTVSVPEKIFKRGRLMFEDVADELEPKRIRTSTPLKSLAKPLHCDLTPIQKNSFASKSGFSMTDKTLMFENNRLSLNKSTEGNVQDRLENLSKEKRDLEEKLRIINEKQIILSRQIMRNSNTRILPGILFKSKNRENRMFLKNYIGICNNGQIDDLVNEINPQNAHLVHFNVCDNSQSHIKTLDGAEIVPNATNKIGLTEIDHGFRSIEGVDVTLIPEGWIDNHFKWIVWKLASYERWTKGKFQDCLTVENVMQQLKYRYDLEIDNAKRSILRKIFEKDDCSQRRMVLCVSDILQKNNSYELELTDGWYSIKTIIDQPLCKQIAKAKIKIGLKLMIYGSEIVNCDEGGHPLETKDIVYLKINFNCTRRALWWCKLGAQQESGPFLIPMSSICASGGKIGRLKCFILRIYPIRYMEKIGNKYVWRNRKAEDHREQEFYNQGTKKCKSYSYKDLQNLRDPEQLYDLLQTSNDPEELQELLSSSQQTILYNYTITNKSASFSNKSCQRTVTTMLKIKLMDVAENSTEIQNFFLWRPGESHLEELKEGDIVTLFNVACSVKWGLASSKLTQFKREDKAKDERFSKFKRKATKFEELPYVFGQAFREFDCVGFVVVKQIQADSQKVWLADKYRRLLLIQIEDSSQNILVLDTVNQGQIISVCNLLIKKCFERYFLAVGDLSVIFARYSQHRHLQEALEEMEEDFGHLDRERFQQECQQKVNKIEGKSAHYMDGMECSQMTMTDMALLECMDKLTG